MDEDIAAALSHLLRLSGGPQKAKEYLETFIDQEQSSSFTNISTPPSGSIDPQQLPAATLLSPLLLPTTNPWQEDYPTEPFPFPDVASLHPEARSHGKHRSDTKHGDATARGLTSGSSRWGGGQDSAQSTPSTPSIRCKADSRLMASVLDDSPAYSRHSTLSPAPTTSMLSPASDQPLSACDLPQTPSREPRRSGRNRNTGVAASPSPLPANSNRTPCPREDDRSRITGLHPDLAAIKQTESTLTKKEFEAVRSKIRADPDYVGELPFIRLKNDQYEIKILVHSPPKSSPGKWYNVSKGTAIGVFNSWAPVSNATQGVSMSQHKSFPTRGQAIVDYQGCLLRGTVILYNEKVEIDDDDEGWW